MLQPPRVKEVQHIGEPRIWAISFPLERKLLWLVGPSNAYFQHQLSKLFPVFGNIYSVDINTNDLTPYSFQIPFHQLRYKGLGRFTPIVGSTHRLDAYKFLQST